MPLPLADALYDHLLDRFPAERAYPRGALYAEGMPPLVAGLLGRTLDRWLEHELDSLESAWFDFNDPGVRAARAELVVALGRTARVPQAAWAETLRYAVGLVVRHLLTPARALTDATFEGETVGTLPTETVRARLHTFEAYPYLPEIADAWLAQKRPEHVTPDALFDLLTRIDRRVTSGYEPADWLRLLGPLFTLARHVPDGGVAASELALFFDAKGLDEAAERLAERGDEAVDEEALHDLLRGLRPEPEPTPEPEPPAAPRPEPQRPEPAEEPPPPPSTPEPRAPLAPAAPDPEPDPEDEGADTPPAEYTLEPSEPPAPPLVDEPEADEEDEQDADEPAPSAADEPEPLWKRYASGGPPPPRPAAAPAPPAEPPADEPPLWQRFLANLRGDTDTPPAESPPAPPRPADRPPAPPRSVDPLDALESRVLGRSDGRRRRRFVRELFRGDDDAYAAVLERLDVAESWTEASRVIARDVFRAFGVDIYGETAVEFTDAVQTRFASPR